MNNLKWIMRGDDGRLSLGFATIEQAVAFIRAQSPNAGWRAYWTFRELENGDAIAESDRCVVIHMPKELPKHESPV